MEIEPFDIKISLKLNTQSIINENKIMQKIFLKYFYEVKIMINYLLGFCVNIQFHRHNLSRRIQLYKSLKCS